MNKKIKIFLVIIICLFVVGSVIAYRMWNKPHMNVKDATSVKTTAVELYNTFLKDSSTAKNKYTDAVVEVSGEVTQVNKNQLNQTVVFLKTNTQDAAINCTMEDTAQNIQPGGQVTIKGICNGYNSGDADMGIPGDILLIRCYTINK
jgi:hypothetical protein